MPRIVAGVILPIRSDPVSLPKVSANAPDAARDVAADFEALVLQAAFAPLAQSLGFYGDAVVSAATRALVRGAGSDLTESFERAVATDASAPSVAGRRP